MRLGQVAPGIMGRIHLAPASRPGLFLCGVPEPGGAGPWGPFCIMMTDMAADTWDEAYRLLVSEGDPRPLAGLIKGTSPIPQRIRAHLGRMLDPDTNPNDADRLSFRRSPALARKMKTHQDRIQVGLAVRDAEKAGAVHKNAVADVGKRFNKSPSYVERCVGLVDFIPNIFRDFGRLNPPVFGKKKTSRIARKKKTKSTARK
jgi:hypothetical protein